MDRINRIYRIVVGSPTFEKVGHPVNLASCPAQSGGPGRELGMVELEDRSLTAAARKETDGVED